jgi:hypothetical protein
MRPNDTHVQLAYDLRRNATRKNVYCELTNFDLAGE